MAEVTALRPAPQPKLCRDCDHWAPGERVDLTARFESRPRDTHPIGECRRMPPIVTRILGPDRKTQLVTCWGDTYADEFCGEFDPVDGNY